MKIRLLAVLCSDEHLESKESYEKVVIFFHGLTSSCTMLLMIVVPVSEDSMNKNKAMLVLCDGMVVVKRLQQR